MKNKQCNWNFVCRLQFIRVTTCSASGSIISVYPVWIHCCKRPNYDFCISQGSAATVLRWGGQITVVYVTFLCDVPCQKLFKLANVSWSYSKNNTGTIFVRHGVLFRSFTDKLSCDVSRKHTVSVDQIYIIDLRRFAKAIYIITRNTLDCDQSNVLYSSRVVFSAIS